MLLHDEIYLDVIRAPNALKPNKDGKIIRTGRTGSEVSVNSVCSSRSCPKKKTFFTCYTVSLDIIPVVFLATRFILVDFFR